MADQEEITREEFRVIFGSSDSEGEGVECSDDSDIDFEGFPAPDSDSEASEDGESEDQSDEEEEGVWSTELQDFALEDFESAAEIKNCARTFSKEPKRGEDGYDRLYKIRPVLKSILEQAQSAYEPSKCMSVDEGMIASIKRCSVY
ncbi:hypothetical protein QZH41_010177 [Actinostola sp. cb2023]|nr:hypothetical protein QZH41_010177 [Actinostola sp. cb2023]